MSPLAPQQQSAPQQACAQVEGFLRAHRVETVRLADAVGTARRVADGARVPLGQLLALDTQLRNARQAIRTTSADQTDWAYWHAAYRRRTYDAVIALLVGVMPDNAMDVARVDDALRAAHCAWRMAQLTKQITSSVMIDRRDHNVYISAKRRDIHALIARNWVPGRSTGDA
jgi:hypothetical protein